MNCLDMFPRYRCAAGTFRSVQDAAQALGEVTVRRDYEPIPKPGSAVMPEWNALAGALAAGEYRRPTLFHEIEAVPGPQPDWAPEVWGLTAGTREVSCEEAAREGVAALRSYLHAHVEREQVYLMPHSAGYDSRLVSLICGEMNDGNMHLVTWQPEVAETTALLEAIGRHRSRVIAVEGEPEDYTAPALDMLSLGVYQSEPDRFIVGPSLAELHMRSSFAEFPTITAAFADETLAFNTARWPSGAYFHAARLLDGPPPWRSSGWIMPFVSEPWLRFLAFYRIENADALKRAMIRLLRPEAADIPNPRYALAREIQEHGYHRWARLSERTRAKLERAYRESWYGQHVKPDFACPVAFGSHAPETRAYIAASICEYLVTDGVIVR